MEHQIRTERRKAGLCTLCGKDPAPGKLFCQEHIEIFRERAQRARETRKKRKLCTSCGVNKPAPNLTKCTVCSEYLKKYHEERRADHTACIQCRKPTLIGKRTCYQCAQKRKNRRDKDRLQAITAYGGECTCCGQKHIEFLQLDHKNNDGAAHRKELKCGAIYRWAIDNGYPDSLQVLCANCNFSRGIYGYCPHRPPDGT